MSIINYIEHLAGKDKLEIEFNICDYIQWAGLKYTRKMDDEAICLQLHRLMKCYSFRTQYCPYSHLPVLDFIFNGFNIVSKIIVNDDVIKVTFTEESLLLRIYDDWITRIL